MKKLIFISLFFISLNIVSKDNSKQINTKEYTPISYSVNISMPDSVEKIGLILFERINDYRIHKNISKITWDEEIYKEALNKNVPIFNKRQNVESIMQINDLIEFGFKNKFTCENIAENFFQSLIQSDVEILNTIEDRTIVKGACFIRIDSELHYFLIY